MVGHHDRVDRLAEAPLGLFDQVCTGAVDGLVHLDQLVAGERRIVGRMARVEPVVTEVACVVGAHEVDTEK